jgi:hypothetical protein
VKYLYHEISQAIDKHEKLNLKLGTVALNVLPTIFVLVSESEFINNNNFPLSVRSYHF